MRHISLDLIRTTEAAAIHASKWIGSGNKEMADKAATDAMRARLLNMDFMGKIVIGEGEKDESYGLFSGELVGSNGNGSMYDIAVDPIEGTTPTVTSGPGAISVLAVAHQDCLLPIDNFYVNKIAYGPKIANRVRLSLNNPLKYTLETVSAALDKPMCDIFVCIMNRPRHEQTIKCFRDLGVRIKLINDCDVTGAVATCLAGSGIDLFYGIGGAPEAVISASAIKCLKGDFQCQVSDDKNNWASKGEVFQLNDLVQGECIFVATGITDGSLLKGVTYDDGIITNSVFMRSESGTIRWMTTHHGN